MAYKAQMVSSVDHQLMHHLNSAFELVTKRCRCDATFPFPSMVVFFVFICLELKVGQYVTSALEEVKNEGRVVRLSVSRLNSGETCAQPGQGWNLTNLLPGLLVNATIKKVKKTLF